MKLQHGIMSRIIALSLLSLLLGFGTGCSRIDPGWGGIVVDLNGEDKGVDDIVVETGRIWYSPFGKQVFQLPHFMQRVAWTKSPAEGSEDNEEITFNSVEGTIIKTDVGFAWSVKKERIPHVFVEFRTTVDDITDGYFRSQVRGAIAECAEDKPLDLIYGREKTEVAKCAFKQVGEVPFVRDNFDLEYLTFIGGFRFDPEVQESINKKIAAENDKKAAIETALGRAQAKREQADGDRDAMFSIAEGHRKLQASLTPQILAYKELELMALKWDGALTKVRADGGEGGTFLQISAE